MQRYSNRDEDRYFRRGTYGNEARGDYDRSDYDGGYQSQGNRGY